LISSKFTLFNELGFWTGFNLKLCRSNFHVQFVGSIHFHFFFVQCSFFKIFGLIIVIIIIITVFTMIIIICPLSTLQHIHEALVNHNSLLQTSTLSWNWIIFKHDWRKRPTRKLYECSSHLSRNSSVYKRPNIFEIIMKKCK